MTHFFISYAKKDTRELALKLSDLLNAVPGVTAWVDRSLRAGKSWELQIQTEIDRCDYMVVLYSPDINRHKQGLEESYVLTEIAYARHTLKKPIIPVMTQATQPPISLTTLHYIDYTLKGLTLDDLLAAICEEANIGLKNKVVSESKKEESEKVLPNIDAMIKDGVRLYKAGKKAEARAIWEKVTELDQYSEQAWLWLSVVVETPDDQRTCLENVLFINPNNANAQKGLETLNAKSISDITEQFQPGISAPWSLNRRDKKSSDDSQQ